MQQVKKILFLVLFMVVSLGLFAKKQYTLASPDGRIRAEISVDKTIEYSVTHSGQLVLDKSPLSMELADGKVWGVNPSLQKAKTASINRTLNASVYKKKNIKDQFNELTLQFKGDYQVIFRAYDDGVAYRFVSTYTKPFQVKNEQAVYNFPQDHRAYIAYTRDQHDELSKQFFNSFENLYAKKFAFSPILIEGAGNKKIVLTEADLLNYPGMYFYNSTASTSLKGVFAPYPKEMVQGGHNRLQELVESREEYIAKYEKGTTFPWRVMVIADNDYELADNDMVYKLASPTVSGDFSWVKPGKVAWDWWSDWNLFNVDFKTGVNNETYKYFIDFAAEHGVEYVILDEGWAVNKQADLFQVVPEINLKELVAYANSKKVGLILWAGYYAFNRDMEKVCKHYAEMGIKGFKVDFMDRDDQLMVDFHHRAAQMGAKYKMMMDFHGTYKPTGLSRTYPNVINYEGVHGLEQMKWSEKADQVPYDVIIPFIRMVAGPMDYTQGAMRNATKKNYRAVYNEAMSQGTRCRQLAEYVIFESPLNMMCDSPSNYMDEKECTDFITAIPTVWDETKAINGEVAKYVTIARKTGDEWYLGSLTNWDARELEVDLSFLGEGDFKLEIFKDGVNADKAARDYKKEVIALPSNRKLKIQMAPGGGFAARIFK